MVAPDNGIMEQCNDSHARVSGITASIVCLGERHSKLDGAPLSQRSRPSDQNMHRPSQKRNGTCTDCGREIGSWQFMARDDLWLWHIPGPNPLCLRCAEFRLGRRFRPDDFKPLPINNWVFRAFAKGRRPTDVYDARDVVIHHIKEMLAALKL